MLKLVAFVVMTDGSPLPRPKERGVATAVVQQRDGGMEVCEEGEGGAGPVSAQTCESMEYCQNPDSGSEEARTGSSAEPPQTSSQTPRYTYR